MSNSLLSFVGGMGAGAMSQYERNKDRARQDRQDDRLDRQEANAKQLHDAQMEEINRAKANRQADIEAASPVVEQEIPTVGLAPGEMGPSPTAPSLGGMQVGKDAYLDPEQGRKVAAAQNTPDGTQARRMQALRTTGRGAEADQLETTLRQGKAADMTLRTGERAEKAAKLQEANTVWNTAVMDSVKKHGNVHAGLAAIMSESEIGPVSGVKFSSVPSKDGKTVQYIATDASGKQSVFKTYATGEAGAMEALQDSMRVSPETQLQFMAERQARAAAAEKAKMDAAEHAAKIKLMGAQGLYYSGRGAAAKAGSGAATSGASLVDRRNFISDLAGSLPDTKNAVTPEEGAAILASNRVIASRADSMFETNAAFGTYLTAPQALTAMELAKDPGQHKLLRDNNTGTIYKTVSVNGKTVVIGVGEAAPKAAK